MAPRRRTMGTSAAAAVVLRAVFQAVPPHRYAPAIIVSAATPAVPAQLMANAGMYV
jgi:hypothetical protein